MNVFKDMWQCFPRWLQVVIGTLLFGTSMALITSGITIPVVNPWLQLGIGFPMLFVAWLITRRL